MAYTVNPSAISNSMGGSMPMSFDQGGFGSGMDSYMNMMSSPWTMGGMGVGGLVGGLMGQHGAHQMQNQIQNGMNNMKQYSDQGLSYLQPYNQAGQDALGKYQDFNKQFSDPSQAYNKIMGQYQMTPTAQFQMQQMQNQMNNSAANSGTMGSPEQQKQMMQFAQGLTSQDQQQYLNNIMGMGNQYESNLGNLMGVGLNAGMGMNQNRMMLGDSIANMYQNMGMAGMNGSQAMGAGLGGLLGGAGMIAAHFL